MWRAGDHMSHSEKLILRISLWLLDGSAYTGLPHLWTYEVANLLDSIKRFDFKCWRGSHTMTLQVWGWASRHMSLDWFDIKDHSCL